MIKFARIFRMKILTKNYIKNEIKANFSDLNKNKLSQRRINKNTDYLRIIKEMENAQISKDKLWVYLRELRDEINEKIKDCYENESLINFAKSVSSKKLCHFAVEHFIGSVSKFLNFFK